MQDIYKYVGVIVTWSIIVGLLIVLIGWLLTLVSSLVIKRNWYQYYFLKKNYSTQDLRDMYTYTNFLNYKNNKKYLLLWRLKNIKYSK